MKQKVTPPSNVWVSVNYNLSDGLSPYLRAVLSNAQNIQTAYNQNTGDITLSFHLHPHYLQQRIITLQKKHDFLLRAHKTAQALDIAHLLTSLLIAEREHIIKQHNINQQTNQQ